MKDRSGWIKSIVVGIFFGALLWPWAFGEFTLRRGVGAILTTVLAIWQAR